MEESIASAISAIQDRLPGLKLYQHIYNEDHELDMRLQDQILSAYESFIEFCIEASKYYKGGGPRKCFSHEPLPERQLTCRILGRWLKALGGPNRILDKANRVQPIIREIRRSCDELLDKNVHSIKNLSLGKSSAASHVALSMLTTWTEQKLTIESKLSFHIEFYFINEWTQTRH